MGGKPLSNKAPNLLESDERRLAELEKFQQLAEMEERPENLADPGESERYAGFLRSKATIHHHLQAAADELLKFIRERMPLTDNGWVAAAEIKQSLELDLVALPKASKQQGGRGWLFATLIRMLEDRGVVEYRKIGSRAFCTARNDEPAVRKSAPVEDRSTPRSKDEAMLKRIQELFHGLIRARVGEANLELPQKLPILRIGMATSEVGAEWLPVPGMYGGFSYWLTEREGEMRLQAASWSRVTGGSGQHHEISPWEIRLIEAGF